MPRPRKMKRSKANTNNLLNDGKYGRIFKLVENYGGGIDEWEKKNSLMIRKLQTSR